MAIAPSGLPVIELGPVITFAIAGVIAPGVARWASIRGVHHLGPSISSPLQQATSPLLAVLGGIVILGEEVGILRALGVAGVIVGGSWIATVRPAVRHAERRTEARRRPKRRDLRRGLVFPMLAALSYAVGDVIVKAQLDDYPHPLIAAIVGIGTAFVAWSGIVAVSPRLRSSLRPGPDAYWFVLSGCFSGIAYLALFSALEAADISLVIPIVATQPLAVFLLSFFFLKGIDRAEGSTIVSGLLIVAGAILVSLS
jgi:drug/metabolite transporter (DMT)-like permease